MGPHECKPPRHLTVRAHALGCSLRHEAVPVVAGLAGSASAITAGWPVGTRMPPGRVPCVGRSRSAPARSVDASEAATSAPGTRRMDVPGVLDSMVLPPKGRLHIQISTHGKSELVSRGSRASWLPRHGQVMPRSFHRGPCSFFARATCPGARGPRLTLAEARRPWISTGLRACFSGPGRRRVFPRGLCHRPVPDWV